MAFVGHIPGIAPAVVPSALCQHGGHRRLARMSSGVKMPGSSTVEVVDDGSEVDLGEFAERAKQFGNAVVVVKYGGAAMSSEDLKEKVVSDVALLRAAGVNVVLVHGGGPDVNVMLKRLSIEPVFHNGLRVTDEETMEVAQMVLAGKINKDLVSMINVKGAPAVGLCGKDASMVRAKQKSPELGLVGDVTEVDPTLIRKLMESGYVPVISSIATSEEGVAYNINADTLAGKIAAALSAQKLVMMTDVPGVMRDPKDITTLFSKLTLGDIEALISEGVISGGMIPKVQCCTDAIADDVRETHIVDGRRPHALLLEIFGGAGIGTMIS